MLVRGGEAEVVPRLAHHLHQGIGIQGARVGEALAAVADDADARATGLGDRQRLHLALVRPHLRLAFMDDHGLDLFARTGPSDDAFGYLKQFGHLRPPFRRQ
ncbi:MAG TPA: hypothetical protein DEP69_00390 [Acidimicrobiaceae bacterium]|nr:hypothetical protein [Acidimicrobiaceae bacterium]